MTVNSKMTALADEIRELSGSTSKKSIDDMASDVGSANTEVASQAELIAQITTALEGKASNSGGVILPTLDNPATASDILSGKEAIDESGNKITGSIATKTSSNLTASGATVTVPAGYYASNATKTITSGSTKTPATTVTKNPTISVNTSGLITASVSGTQNVTPTVSAGYVSSGTAGTITVSGSATKQLTTQAAKTITPSTSSQTAVAKNVYTTGAVTVAAIPSNYEDVGTETSAYTTKLESLETAVAALETELQGKASGGSGGAKTCTVTIEQLSLYGIPYIIYGVDSDGSIIEVTMSSSDSSVSITTTRGLLAVLSPTGSLPGLSVSGSVEYITSGYMLHLFSVQGDGQIIYTDQGGN
jgi:hypothetical protein